MSQSIKSKPPRQNRRDFFKTGGAIAIGALAGAPLLQAELKEKQKMTSNRPNLLFFFTDQQSWDMIGVNGNKQVKTPYLDKFAETATNFNHCVSSCCVCTPARGMIMSGQHPLHNGAFSNDAQLIPSVDSMGSILHRENYQTCYIGKWHLYGGPRPRPIPKGEHRHGFNTFLSNNATLDFRPGHAFYYTDEGDEIKFQEWEAYGQTNQAVDFINNCSKDKPFALYLSLHPPHDQGLERNGLRYNSIPDLMKRYDRDSIKKRRNIKIPDDPSGDGTKKYGGEEAFYEMIKDDYHGYYSMISGCDDCFGMVLDALKRNGLDENTIVVFTSDHGDQLHSHGRPWPKSFPEDPSVRVPLLIRNPGKTPENHTSNLLFGTLDFMPTLLSMMGIQIPDSCHGQDLSRAIYQKNDMAVSEVPLFYFIPGWRGIYTHRYTYAWDEFGGNEWQHWNVLYDREIDPYQTNNLFNKEEFKSIQAYLHSRATAWLDHFEDPFIPSYEMLKMLGEDSPFFSHPGKTGVFGGRPIDLIHDYINQHGIS
jgi:arylsulfatase A-like enzyme